jgi:hypothetical protein
LLDLRRRTVTQTDSGWEGGVSQPTISAVWKTFYNDIPIGFRTYGASYALNNEKVVLASGSANYIKVSVPIATTGVYNIRLAYEKDEAPSPNGSYFLFTRNACSGSNFTVRPKMRYNNSVYSSTLNGKACTIGNDEVDIYFAAGTAEFEIKLEAGTAHITGIFIGLVKEATCEIPCSRFGKYEESTASQGFVDTGGVMLRKLDTAHFEMPNFGTSGVYILGVIPPTDEYAIRYYEQSNGETARYSNDTSYPYGTSQGAHFYGKMEITTAPNETVSVGCLGNWAHIISLICV